MPYVAPLHYHDVPELPALLDFFCKCQPSGQQMAARYGDARKRDLAVALFRRLELHPLHAAPAEPWGGASLAEPPLLSLRLSCPDWNALASSVVSMLAGELRLLFRAADEAARIVPLRWDALPLADQAFAAWGTAAGMVALPLQTASSYLESRYPAKAPERRELITAGDADAAKICRDRHALGFLVATQDGTRYLACHDDDWRKEVASSTYQLGHHLSLLMRTGLQMAQAGNPIALPDMFWALACANSTPWLEHFHSSLLLFHQFIQIMSPADHHFASRALHLCMVSYKLWQDERKQSMDLRILRPDAPSIPLESLAAFDAHPAVGGASLKRLGIGPHGHHAARADMNEAGGMRIGRAHYQSAMAIDAITSQHGAPPATIDESAFLSCQRPAGGMPALRGQAADRPAGDQPFAAFRRRMAGPPCEWAAQRQAWLASSGLAGNENMAARAAGAIVRVPTALSQEVAPVPAPSALPHFQLPVYPHRAPWL